MDFSDLNIPQSIFRPQSQSMENTYCQNVIVEIQNNDHHSIHNFVHELEELNIYEKLHTSVDSRPEENYGILLKLLSTAKDKHLPTKIVKFNRKKLLLCLF